MKTLYLTFILSIAVLFSNTAFAQSGSSYYDWGVDRLKTELKDAQLLQVLGNTSNTIDGARGCNENIKQAKKFKKELIILNDNYSRQSASGYDSAADAKYKLKEKELRDNFRYSMHDYENIPRFPGLTGNGITTLKAHKAKFGELSNKLTFSGSVDIYISILEKRIAELEDINNGDIVGIITGVFRTVEYLPEKSTDGKWLKVGKGLQLRLRDQVRTGPKGRVTISVTNHYSQGRSEFAIAYIAPNSHVLMESNFSLTTMELIDGIIRANKRKWQRDSGTLRIRSGTTIAGIRGTELAMSYDKNTGKTDVHLDHGDAYVEVSGRKTALQPRTSVTVSNGAVSMPRPLSRAAWKGIVKSTDSIGDTTSTITGTRDTATPIIPSRRDENAIAQELAEIVARTSGDYVSSIVDNFNRAMMNYDKAAAFKYLENNFQTNINKILETKTFRQMVDTDGVVVKAKNNCSVCWREDNTEFCTVKTKLHYEGGRLQKTTLFYLRETDGDFEARYKIYQLSLVNAENLKSFEKRKPYCDNYQAVQKTRY